MVFFAQVYSPITGQTSCGFTNLVFAKYHGYGYALILTGFLPFFITILFGLMAFLNVRQLAYRAVPIVRRELEKQLTVMVLVQVAVNSFLILPSEIVYALEINTGLMSNPNLAANIVFASNISTLIYYLSFAVSINVA